jgi:peptidoglycan hydrolase-like protein with peptidoglycan-binding domain
MRIIKLTESDLEKIVKKVLKEDADALPEMENIPLGKVEAVQQALVDAGYDIGPTGVDGKFGSNTRAAVIKYQKDNGIKQTGNVGPLTGGKLGVQPLTSGKPSTQTQTKTTPKTSQIQTKTGGKTSSKLPQFTPLKPSSQSSTYVTPPIARGLAIKTIDKKTQTTISGKFSEQVRKQLQYMKNNNLLSNEKFTIVDDKNSQVHAFLPSYKLVRTYYVITGKNKGDQLKTQSMTDWVMKNWTDVGAKFFSSIYNQTKNLATGNKAKNPLQDVADYIDGCYFGQKEWNLKNTPSGVFKRAGNVTNFMNDLLATTFIEKDYGARFITWETCDGKTIPFGFHGTKNEARLPVLNAKNIERQSCSKRKMSFGCINFGDADVKEISSFITDGQLSIWLPDTSDNIVEIPSNCVSGSGPQKSIMSYDYMTQNYGKGFK